MTLQEANVLLSCKSTAVRDFTIGALTGATVAWGGKRVVLLVFCV